MFPEDVLNLLPPTGLSLVWKGIVYSTILEFIFVSLIFYFVLRKKGISDTSFEEPISITLRVLGTNADRVDVITGLRVEIAGYQAALETLKNAVERNEISEKAYKSLKSFYDLKVDEVKNSLTVYSDTTILDIDEELSQIEVTDEGLEPEELTEIEGALTQLVEEDSPSAPSVPPSPPSPPSAPSVAPSPPSPPSAPSVAPSPPSPPSAPSVPPSSKETPPPPPPPAEPTETENEGVFAKSTSIAALRMEMLKELAKLKKLSESMGEKE